MVTLRAWLPHVLHTILHAAKIDIPASGAMPTPSWIQIIQGTLVLKPALFLSALLLLLKFFKLLAFQAEDHLL